MLMHWTVFLWALWTPQSTLTPRHLEKSRFDQLPIHTPFRRDERFYLGMAMRAGGGVDTEAALACTLEALARCQTEDGSWAPPAEGSGIEVTGLALLAYLRAGWNLCDQKKLSRSSWRFRLAGGGASVAAPDDPPYHQVLRRGIVFLLHRQSADGFIGERDARHALRDHAIATNVLLMACDRQGFPTLHYATEQALAALVAGSSSWTKGESEVAGWAAQTLLSARFTYFPVDQAAWDALKAPFLKPVAANLRDPVIDCLVWSLLPRKDPALDQRPPPLPDLQPKTSRARYWTARALMFWYGPGLTWTKWNEPMKAELLSEKTSDPESLAFRALTLEVYYRH